MSRIARLTRVGLVALVAAAPVVGSAGAAQAQRTAEFSQTREIANAGRAETFDASVTVSHTTNLFNRQQVAIELAGFKPTYNANNTVNNGVYMEYPVVVMQCRGATPTPETCANERRSVWYPGYDAAAPEELYARARSVRSPGSAAGFPGATPREQRANALRAEQLGFDAADGVRYLWESTVDTDGTPWIDEPGLKSFPPPDTADGGTSVLATRSVPVRADGTNEFLFEVRQRVSQPSLGCTDTDACSIVVVPIMDMACAEDAPADCGGAPLGFEPGSVGQGPTTVNQFLTQRTWFAESNWRNRFVVPIAFAPDPASCSVQDQRPILPVYGSELADVAQQRWGAAYCAGARPADYLPLYTQGSEYDGRRQFTSMLGTKYGQDAVLTTQPVLDSPRPVVHAPSALTGFTVAFTIDDADGRQVRELTLSPRLLAKLLTQSYSPGRVSDAIRDSRARYTGSAEQVAAIQAAGNGNGYYWEHPAVYANPSNIFVDREFLALNPDLKLRGAGGSTAGQFLGYLTPVVFQVQSDIVVDLTTYIASDPAARAWLDGQPDEQGMVVNPVWQGMRPFELYSLLDQEVRPERPHRPTYHETNPQFYLVPGAGDECDGLMRTPLLTRQANITNAAETAATALLDRRGSATPLCTFTDVPVPPDQRPDPVPPGQNPDLDRIYAETKTSPADFGQRAMLAVTTVPHARLYELPTARLVNAGGVAVAPTAGTMLGALAAAVQDQETGTIRIDHTRVTGDAYPGTMVAFTAAPSAGLDPATAARYADFIEFMATDGQVPGSAITNLPPGYDPLPPNLRQQALDAARAVREQQGEVPPPPAGGPLGGGTPSGSAPGGPAAGPGAPVAPQAEGEESAEVDRRAAARTEGAGSWLSRWALPALIGFGVLAALAAFLVTVFSRPDHPVRQALRAVMRR